MFSQAQRLTGKLMEFLTYSSNLDQTDRISIFETVNDSIKNLKQAALTERSFSSRSSDQAAVNVDGTKDFWDLTYAPEEELNKSITLIDALESNFWEVTSENWLNFNSNNTSNEKYTFLGETLKSATDLLESIYDWNQRAISARKEARKELNEFGMFTHDKDELKKTSHHAVKDAVVLLDSCYRGTVPNGTNTEMFTEWEAKRDKLLYLKL